LNTTLFIKDFKGNDPLFISFMLRTIDFESHSGKSGVPGVNRNDLHGLDVVVPPPSEQCTIAAALSDVDALIAALDKLISKKRAIKTAAMQQLLTGKLRLPGLAGSGR
jgi:type I restriction enzyme S subunit